MCRFVVPGTKAAQIFLFDPDRCVWRPVIKQLFRIELEDQKLQSCMKYGNLTKYIAPMKSRTLLESFRVQPLGLHLQSMTVDQIGKSTSVADFACHTYVFSTLASRGLNLITSLLSVC